MIDAARVDAKQRAVGCHKKLQISRHCTYLYVGLFSPQTTVANVARCSSLGGNRFNSIAGVEFPPNLTSLCVFSALDAAAAFLSVTSSRSLPTAFSTISRSAAPVSRARRFPTRSSGCTWSESASSSVRSNVLVFVCGQVARRHGALNHQGHRQAARGPRRSRHLQEHVHRVPEPRAASRSPRNVRAKNNCTSRAADD